MTEPFSISFIIPYYELGKDLLLRAIGSVLDLRLEYDWELIVVDDGSKRFPARQWVEACGDSRIRYVWKENGGLGPARNTGAELATKSYIQFLDADDYLLADGFRQAATLTEKERPDILYYRYKMTYGTGKESVQAEKQTFVERFSSGAEYMATRNLRGSSTQMLVRRHLVQTTPFVNIYFEDEHFSPRLLLIAGTVIDTNFYGYAYYQRPGSIINSTIDEQKAIKRFGDMRFIIRSMMELCTQQQGIAHQALQRRIDQLTLAAVYRALQEAPTRKMLNDELQQLRAMGCYPLAKANYSPRYRLFRLLTNRSWKITIMRLLLRKR